MKTLEVKSQTDESNLSERDRIMLAALSLMDKPVVTQNDIARIAVVHIGRITVWKNRDSEIAEAVGRAVKTPRQRIITAITYFEARKEKSGPMEIIAKAMVGTTAFYKWYKNDTDIKNRVDSLRISLSFKGDIIEAIQKMNIAGEALSDAVIIEKAGVSQRVFYKHKKDPSVVKEIEDGEKPATTADRIWDVIRELKSSNVLVVKRAIVCKAVDLSNIVLWRDYELKDPELKNAIKDLIKQSRRRSRGVKSSTGQEFSPFVKARIYFAVRALKRQLEFGKEVSKEIICRVAKVSMSSLVAYEENDPVLKEDIRALLPLFPAGKIEIAFQRMCRINQMPTIEAFVLFTRLPKEVVQKAIDEDESLRNRIEELGKNIKRMKKSFTYQML